MIRAQSSTGGSTVHLWPPDATTASEQALCGETGPALTDQAGPRCAECWRIHGSLFGSAFQRAADARLQGTQL
jgi:hypothetical protein